MVRKRNIAAALRKAGNEKLREIATDLKAPGDLGRAIPAPVRGTETDVTDAPGHTDIYTYFTRPEAGTQLFYNAEKWVRVKLLLETGGPVSVSTRQNILPVLSGKGISLRPDEVEEFELARGDRLFIASTSENRVQVITQPIPWLESILLTNKKGIEATIKSIVETNNRVAAGLETMGKVLASALRRGK